MEFFRGRIAGLIFLAGIVGWLLLASALVVSGVRHTASVAQHEEAPSEPLSSRFGSTDAAPAEKAKMAYGIYLDESLVAILAVWPSGETRIATTLSPDDVAQSVIVAAQGVPHGRIFVTSKCTP